MSKKIRIILSGGTAYVSGKPDDIEVEIRDHDIEGDWDPDNSRCKTDDDGDRYQEIIFPAIEPPQVAQVELTVRSYYEHCNTQWDADWDCACDDECPVCQKAISPYKHEDIKDLLGWQPTGEEFPVAGLQSFEVYENLEMGKGCHTEVKKWIPIYEDDIEAVIIIPYDGKNT